MRYLITIVLSAAVGGSLLLLTACTGPRLGRLTSREMPADARAGRGFNAPLTVLKSPASGWHRAAKIKGEWGGKDLREISAGVDEVWVISKPAASERAAKKGMSSRIDPGLSARDPKTKKLVPMPLKQTKVRGQISAYVAKVMVEQQYQNPYEAKIEAVYVFPLPQNSAVTDFIMTIGDRKIRGMIRERKEAEKIYEEAKKAGYRAALLTQERPNIFTQKVANIEPGKRIDINITYFNTLKYAKGEYEFVFPMVVGPRFNPPGFTDGIGAKPRGVGDSSAQPTNVEYLAPNERSGHEIDLQVSIDAGVPIESFQSPSHAIDVQRRDDHKLTASLKPNDRIPNKDFVFRYKVAGKTMKTAFLHHEDKHGKTFSVVLVPPAKLTDVPVQPREMIFVVDCSGSMSGRPMAAAKDAMRRCLRNLDPRDSFQIIRFSETAFQFGKAPVPASKKNVRAGLDYIDKFHGTGGTMMIEGIKAALDMPHDKEKLRIVSFMTDGYIGNEAQIIAAIRQKLGSARIFSFGVGNSVNRYLIEAMAREGRGAAAYVGLDEGSAKAVDAFYARAKHAALVDVKIDWNGMGVKDVFPKRIPDLLVGRPVVITGRYTGKLPQSIKVNGMMGGKQNSYEVSVAGYSAKNDGVRFVWARSKMAELAMANIHKPSAELRDAMIRFSTEQSVLCEYTAFLAVDGSERTEGNEGYTTKVPVPVPDGVKYETTVDP